MVTTLAICVAAPVATAGESGETAKPAEVPAGAKSILSRDSYWRWFLTLRKPIISVEALKAAGQPAEKPRPLTGKVVPPPYNRVDRLDSRGAPAGWEASGFDDRGWPRSRLTWLRGKAFSRFSSAVLCLRGKFRVSNPSAVQGLYLTIRYYGGVRVLLNGKEVARAHLPAGKLAADASAELYPKDVHLDAKGKVVMGGYCCPPKMRKDKDRLRRIAKRTRVLGPLKLPAGAIRKGENLLAVEVRRSEYPYLAFRWFKRPEGATKPFWVPMNLFNLHLQAVGTGAVPNVARPKGLQVWSENTVDRITPLDYGDVGEGLRPVRIDGARNGSFCGQFVVGSGTAIKGLKVTAGEFKATKGAGTIPAKNVTVLYALANVAYYGMTPWFDALQDRPRAEVPVAKGGGAVQPVLLRVKIPADAPAGDYRGELTASAAGAATVKVPVEISVADWTVPDPGKYRTYVGIYQSPTTVATQYKVKMWSEDHWKLLEKSFELLARAGNKMINVPVVDHTQFGNDRGFVTWVRKPDPSTGSGQAAYDYDFKVFDRYLDLAVKHCGKLDYLALQIWHAGGWKHRGANQKNTVTVRDEKTGELSRQQVPRFDSPEARTFWKPVLAAIKERLAKRGMEKALCVGILSDSTAPPEVFRMFDEVLPPAARWHRGCHVGGPFNIYRANKGGGLVVLHEHCYGLRMASPEKKLPAFWNLRGKPGTCYDRISNHERYMSLAWYRNTGMLSLFRRKQGIGRVCLDFWPVLGKGHRRKWIYNRYPESTCAQREPSMQKMTWPGPEGAATTMRYEALLEGIQDAEAVIVVSEAMDKHAAVIGLELVEECNAILVDLLRYQFFATDRGPLRPMHAGWQDLSRRLYECAAKVSKKIKGK
jgi:hypothetical protein